jgi:hypothetical protein
MQCNALGASTAQSVVKMVELPPQRLDFMSCGVAVDAGGGSPRGIPTSTQHLAPMIAVVDRQSRVCVI